MLDAALKFWKVFDFMEIHENKFVDELSKMKGVPTYDDCEHAGVILPFLELFYNATLKVSGSYYVTTNHYMKEIYGIGMMIRKYCSDEDMSLALMVERMKLKFEKYWGNVKNINVMLFIAIILDPRHKLNGSLIIFIMRKDQKS